jgi:hypothetical protein
MRHHRAMTGRCLWPRAALVLLGALMLTGCASAVALRVPKAGPETTCITPAPDREVLVGVALSGGGSRAALFGAAGLEALGRLQAPGGGSVLEQMTYLSSVSGGSVAATYYASQKPPRETAVLTPEGTFTAEYETFFAGAHEKLRQDFEGALLRRQLLSFRWLNSSLAARSLAEVMAERLLGSTTFVELAQREARGDSPRLIINTTLYNSGRRLALTTLPPDASRYDFYADLRASLTRRELTAEFPPAFLQRWEKLLTLTPLELGIDVCPIRLAGAVAGSASFPPWSGPSPSGSVRRTFTGIPGTAGSTRTRGSSRCSSCSSRSSRTRPPAARSSSPSTAPFPSTWGSGGSPGARNPSACGTMTIPASPAWPKYSEAVIGGYISRDA